MVEPRWWRLWADVAVRIQTCNDPQWLGQVLPVHVDNRFILHTLLMLCRLSNYCFSKAHWLCLDKLQWQINCKESIKFNYLQSLPMTLQLMNDNESVIFHCLTQFAKSRRSQLGLPCYFPSNNIQMNNLCYVQKVRSCEFNFSFTANVGHKWSNKRLNSII